MPKPTAIRMVTAIRTQPNSKRRRMHLAPQGQCHRISTSSISSSSSSTRSMASILPRRSQQDNGTQDRMPP